MRSFLPRLLALILSIAAAAAAPVDDAVEAINGVGLELLARQPAGNAVLSPYSLQAGLVLSYAGADGTTRAEMRRALHYPADDLALHAGFSRLRRTLAEGATGERDAPTLILANRLFAQSGHPYLPEYQALVKDQHDAPLHELDIRKDPASARKEMNAWISGRTFGRIDQAISELSPETKLMLISSLFLKARWHREFLKSQTKPRPFSIPGSAPQLRPAMRMEGEKLAYRKLNGSSAVTLQFNRSSLGLLIILPDRGIPLERVLRTLSAAELRACSRKPLHRVNLTLPKFQLANRADFTASLTGLGAGSAFSEAADFGRMSATARTDQLCLGGVQQEVRCDVDEEGIEAAAVTLLPVTVYSANVLRQRPKPPIEFIVDRPFLFAVQDAETGACLILGRVADPH